MLFSSKCVVPSRNRAVAALPALAAAVLAGVCHAGDTSDLVGHWTFDEGAGTSALDSSGLGNHGSIIGGASYVAGVAGTGLQLNGTNAYVNCGNSASLNPVQSMTVSAWFKATVAWSGSGSDPIVDKGIVSHTWPYYQYHVGISGTLYPSAPGSIGFTTSGGAGAGAPGGTVVVGVWRMYTATTDATRTRFYVDGELVQTGPGGLPMTDYGKPLLFGKFANLSLYLPGVIDDIQIYSRALTCSEVRCMFENPGQEAQGFPEPAPDINGDGVVNGGDLGLLLASWGDCSGGGGSCDTGCLGDLDCSGTVDGSDLGVMLAAWGPVG